MPHPNSAQHLTPTLYIDFLRLMPNPRYYEMSLQHLLKACTALMRLETSTSMTLLFLMDMPLSETISSGKDGGICHIYYGCGPEREFAPQVEEAKLPTSDWLSIRSGHVTLKMDWSRAPSSKGWRPRSGRGSKGCTSKCSPASHKNQRKYDQGSSGGWSIAQTDPRIYTSASRSR